MEQKTRFATSDYIRPVISNAKYNEYLKEIAKILGIEKRVTSHLARHTFATTVTYANGISIETISKMLGHTKLSTTQIYARIVDQTVSREMDKLSAKLSGTSFDMEDYDNKMSTNMYGSTAKAISHYKDKQKFTETPNFGGKLFCRTSIVVLKKLLPLR